MRCLPRRAPRSRQGCPRERVARARVDPSHFLPWKGDGDGARHGRASLVSAPCSCECAESRAAPGGFGPGRSGPIIVAHSSLPGPCSRIIPAIRMCALPNVASESRCAGVRTPATSCCARSIATPTSVCTRPTRSKAVRAAPPRGRASAPTLWGTCSSCPSFAPSHPRVSCHAARARVPSAGRRVGHRRGAGRRRPVRRELGLSA